MAVDMSDDNDDLDAFARLFGATPETPPEGLQPPADPWATVAAAPAAAAPADPLGWLLSDAPATAVFPRGDEYAPAPSYPAPSYPAPSYPAAATTATATLAEPTQVLPTRRSLAAEAARASREAHRRNLIILGGIGAVVLVLVVVLILVLVAKNGSSGSPDALLKQAASPSPSSSSTETPTPTPTATASETPTPTPTPTQVRTVAPPPPSAPTVTASVAGQVTCNGGSPTTITIAYTTTNAATLNLSSSDGSVNTNLTPAASGTISPVLYQCDGSGESYTLTAYSSSEGVTPATATVTPTPAG